MISRQLGTFLIVGTLTVIVDYLTYRGLLFAGMPSVALAKGISFLAGTLFAYGANRLWTFRHTAHAPGSHWRFIGLYSLTLGVNVAVNALALYGLQPFSYAVQAAFLLATGISATLNYIGMKYYVFTARETAP